MTEGGNVLKIIVIGAGKIGTAMCEQLVREQYDVTVLDNNPAILKTLSNTLDVFGIQGSGVVVSDLEQAGAATADLLIAVTDSDAVNILACSIAKRLGAKHTIARVRSPEYSELINLMKSEWGLSMTINPELSVAKEVSRIVRFPSAAKLESFVKGRVNIAEFKLTAENPLCGMALADMRRNFRQNVLICAVRRADETFVPAGDFIFQRDDIVSVTGADRDIEAFCRADGIYRKRIKKVLIVGGGKVTYYLINQLQDTGMNITVIEKQKERARELAEQFADITVIWGDGTDQELLMNEGLDHADAFIALTGLDEQNIIVSMHAMLAGVHKVITKVNQSNLANLARNTGLESVVSSKSVTAAQVLRHARATCNSTDAEFESLHRIANDSAEALEFVVREPSDVTDVPLKDLPIKPNTLIACITRGNRIIIPSGNDSIQVGDTIIVVTTNLHINSIKDILKS